MAKEPEVFEIPDNANIVVKPILEPSLSNEQSDPFTKHKTEPDKFHYRALNKKAQNVSMKEAMGYKTIGGAAVGDLILAKIPRELYEARKKSVSEKTRRQTEAARDRFREEAARSGVKIFEDK